MFRVNSASKSESSAVNKLTVLDVIYRVASHENGSSFKSTNWFEESVINGDFILRHVEDISALDVLTLITFQIASTLLIIAYSLEKWLFLILRTLLLSRMGDDAS